MQNNATPAATCVTHIRPATPAERSFRVYMLDQFSAKHFAIFLINQEIIRLRVGFLIRCPGKQHACCRTLPGKHPLLASVFG